jgi:hypothetical protein
VVGGYGGDTYAAGEVGYAEHEVFHLGGGYVLVAEEDDSSLGD